MQDAISLVQLLKNYQSASPAQSQVNRLIEYCWQLAAAILRKRYGSRNQLFNPDANSIEDTAIDAITPLFSGEKPGLLTSLEQWWKPVNTEAEAAWFLNSLLLRRVNQQVGILLKTQSPVFAHLLKVVNYHISVNDWAKISHFGTLFIVESGTTGIIGRTIDSEIFEQFPDELFYGRIGQVIRNLFQFIHTSGLYFPAIPLYRLVRQLELWHNLNWETDQAVQEYNPEVDEIFRIGLDQTLRRLKQIYLDKNKLSIEEGRTLETAFQEIVRDMQDGGINRSLLEYLRTFMPQLETARFYQRYRPVMEYLLRTMKNSMREAWQEI